MKKVIILPCLIAMAITTHAATAVTWASGSFYTATNAKGGWSETTVKDASAVVTMSVYLVDETTYKSLSSKASSGVYDWSKTQTAKYSGENKNKSGAIIPAISVGTDELGKSTTYYSVLIASYTDASLGAMYMTATREFTTSASGQYSLSNIFGGAGSAETGGVRNWASASTSPVPEPTSGFLMLLGFAGLALRRKHV